MGSEWRRIEWGLERTFAISRCELSLGGIVSQGETRIAVNIDSLSGLTKNGVACPKSRGCAGLQPRLKRTESVDVAHGRRAGAEMAPRSGRKIADRKDRNHRSM
jgi:hypothetical protein